MVHIVRLLSAAALATVSSAAPMMRRDSAIGDEVAVSAPNGIVMSDLPTSTADSYGSYQTSSSYDSSNSYESTSSSCDNGDCESSMTLGCDSGNCDSTSTMELSSTMGCDSGNCDSTSTMGCDSGNCDSTSTMLMCDSGNCDLTSTMDDFSSTMGCDSGNCDTTSTMYESSTTLGCDSGNCDTSSTVYEYTSSTMYEYSSSTSTAYMSYSTPSYGSGSSNWGGSGYNDCVMQCAASFGMPSATWEPPTATQDSSMYGGESGSNGVTHTIIVAPSQGVLRYVPFSTNASVGDTISFHWNAGPHTVTQSSGLEVCNKTDISTAFASGDQNAGFTWNMVINDTKPIWFYCGVKTHCEQGMFGGININEPNPDMQGSAPSDYVSLGSVAENMTSSNSDMMAAWQYSKMITSNDSYANNWGMNINVVGMSNDAMMQTMKNVLWTQTLIAANPGAVDKDKGFHVSNQNLVIPGDISNAIAQAPAPSNTSSTDAASAATSAASSAGAAAATTSSANKNGAVSVTSSSVAFAFVAIVASFMML